MNKLSDDLEALIDAYGLSEVLYAVSNVCAEKADHVGQYSDSKYLAANWKRAGERVRYTAATQTVQAVSP